MGAVAVPRAYDPTRGVHVLIDTASLVIVRSNTIWRSKRCITCLVCVGKAHKVGD